MKCIVLFALAGDSHRCGELFSLKRPTMAPRREPTKDHIATLISSRIVIGVLPPRSASVTSSGDSIAIKTGRRKVIPAGTKQFQLSEGEASNHVQI